MRNDVGLLRRHYETKIHGTSNSGHLGADGLLLTAKCTIIVNSKACKETFSGLVFTRTQSALAREGERGIWKV